MRSGDALCRPRTGACPAPAPTELVPAGGAPEKLVLWLHRSHQLLRSRSAPEEHIRFFSKNLEASTLFYSPVGSMFTIWQAQSNRNSKPLVYSSCTNLHDGGPNFLPNYFFEQFHGMVRHTVKDSHSCVRLGLMGVC